MKVVIVKLGGSVITAKSSGRPAFRAGQVRRLSREAAGHLRRRPETALIVLHGAGSFGHPLAHAYGLVDGRPTKRRLAGLALTQAAMLRLNAKLVGALRAAGLPAAGVATHLVVKKKRGRVRIENRTVIRNLLLRKHIPVLYGDAIMTDENKTDIVSADELAVVFSRWLSAKRIIFATDVNGVYEDARRARAIPRLSRRGLRALLNAASYRRTRTDVTGGMIGKLKVLLGLRRVSVSIINGLKPGSLLKALHDQNIGTRIQL